MPVQRRTELHRRRVRRQKLAKLRRRYEAAESDAERVAVVQKLTRVAPWVIAEMQRGGPAGTPGAPAASEAPARRKASRAARPRPEPAEPQPPAPPPSPLPPPPAEEGAAEAPPTS